MDTIEVIVKDVVQETPLIRSFLLQATDESPLNGFDPGAHVRISLPDGGDRAYSLINLDPSSDASNRNDPGEYRIAVRLEEESTGGSQFMHGLQAGATLKIAPPKNDFELAGEDGPVILLAGGIGITPLTGMAARLTGAGREFELHYCGRSRGALAFVEPLKALVGDKLTEHYDDEPDMALNLQSLIGGISPAGHLYICGPKGMIEAASSAARARGFAEDHIHFELFTNQAAATAGDAFEIELASTGEVLPVPEGKSIIEVLEDAGHDVLYDCQRGDCGICQTEVVSGTPDHRDVVLSDDEKASGKVMQICVSRAKTPRLVLDL